MYSWNVYKFSYRLYVSVRAVVDQRVDINLRDMHGTNNIVKYLLKILRCAIPFVCLNYMVR